MTLIELTSEAKLLQFLLDEHASTNDGDISDIGGVIETWESQNSIDISAKAEALIRVMKTYQMASESQGTEIKRMSESKKANDNHYERLKSYLLFCMQSSNLDKINAGPYKITVCEASQRSLVIDVDETEIPDQYVIRKKEINFRSLKKAVEDGDEAALKFAHLSEKSKYVRIK